MSLGSAPSEVQLVSIKHEEVIGKLPEDVIADSILNNVEPVVHDFFAGSDQEISKRPVIVGLEGKSASVLFLPRFYTYILRIGVKNHDCGIWKLSLLRKGGIGRNIGCCKVVGKKIRCLKELSCHLPVDN